MRTSVWFVGLLAFTLITCSKDKAEVRGPSWCVAVQYKLPYCPVRASIVAFLEPQPGIPNPYPERGNVVYGAAVLDLPDEFKKTDTIFYLTYHYDPVREKRENAEAIEYCPMNIGLSPLIVSESASWQPCQ